MSLNAEEIGLVVEILKKDLVGAVVREALSPEALDRIALELRTPGENHFLQIVVSAGSSRFGRVEKKPKAQQTPHPFVMLLRKEIVGKVISDVVQIGGDRAVQIDLQDKTESQALILELTSRHANIFLTDANENILGSFFPNRSHKRRLVPGEPYVPPIPHEQTGKRAPRFDGGHDIEARIEEHYLRVESASLVDQEANDTRRLAKAAARRLERLLNKLDADLARAKQGEDLANLGHLIKANLYAIKKGETSAEVYDFNGEKTRVPLNPKLTPVQNMEQLFNKAKRLTRAVSKIEQRREKISSDYKWIESALMQIEGADGELLDNLREQIRKRFPKIKATAKRGTREVHERLPFKELAVFGGRVARVGRSARDNDALTLRHARPDDLWLHARGRTGSHVVVPMGRGEDPSPELLVDAAHLAAHFSDARGEADVEIMYTRRRYVQKPKGAAPGSVRVLKEKAIMLRVEPQRLERLLGSNPS